MRDIHEFFGLSYSNYLILHRTLLQSMPEEWQLRFVEMLDELREAFDHIKQPETFQVITGNLRSLQTMTNKEIRLIGYDVIRSITENEEDEYFNCNGTQIDPDMSAENVCYPMPDPIPHYDKGRTYIKPKLSPVASYLFTDETVKPWKYAGEKPTKKEFQEALGGEIYFRPVDGSEKNTLVVKEGARILKDHINYNASIHAGFTIFGNAILIESNLLED